MVAMLLSMTVVAAEEDTVIAIYNGTEYTSMEALLRDYTYGEIMLQADVQDLKIEGLVLIDLNGHNINNVTVTEDALLCCKDTQTSDYSVSDGVYGKITGTINGTIGEIDDYVQIQEGDGISFHRVNMGIHEMTLRPSVAGIYYSSYFAADEVVAAQVERYGIAMSVKNSPTEDNIETECVCSYFERLEPGQINVETTTLLKNIMKATNTADMNRENSLTYVFGTPYMKTASGYIWGDMVLRNLKEQVEAADARWDTLNAEQQAALTAMYETFSEEMASWDAPNVKGEDPDSGEIGGGADGGDGEDITLIIGLPMTGGVEDYDSNAFTLWLEEKTGYNLEFYYYNSNPSNMRAEINTQVAYGEKLPDIWWNVNLGDSTVSSFGQNGYLKDLSAYFNDRTGASKTFWDRMENELSQTEQQQVLGRMKDPNDGKIYTVPSVELSPVDTMDYQVWINQEWLDALDLEMPTDAQSLYEVLVAFKNQDPNGNGMKDEVPLMGSQGSVGANLIDWLVNLFVYMDDTTCLNVDNNGKVYAPFTTDAYRQALIYTHKLYSERLLKNNALSASGAELRMMISSGICGVVAANWETHIAAENEILYQYTALPNWGYSVINPIYKATTFITGDCEHPDEAFNLLMLMWSEEGAKRMRFGVYGTNWTDPDEGAVSVTGVPAGIKILSDPYVNSGNAVWKAIASTLLRNGYGETSQVNGTETQWELFRDQLTGEAWKNYQVAAKNNPKNICPVLTYTETEKDENLDAITQCKSYYEQMRTRFIVSSDPADDAAWNAYLATLEEYGLQQWLEVAQTAYDRQK